MDLRVGGHVYIQDVNEVDFDENEEVFFPLKNLFDRAHGTLEGLSAPYGFVGDVAPQGLGDLGCPPDTGPVGSTIGDEPEAGALTGSALEPSIEDSARVPDEPPGPARTDAQDEAGGGAPVDAPPLAEAPDERPHDLPGWVPWPFPSHLGG